MMKVEKLETNVTRKLDHMDSRLSCVKEDVNSLKETVGEFKGIERFKIDNFVNPAPILAEKTDVTGDKKKKVLDLCIDPTSMAVSGHYPNKYKHKRFQIIVKNIGIKPIWYNVWYTDKYSNPTILNGMVDSCSEKEFQFEAEAKESNIILEIRGKHSGKGSIILNINE